MKKETAKPSPSYLIFARKYRPQTFDEVIGQEAITATLKNAILENKVPQSFLFTGTRGVGKTSLARILAKSLNCVQGPTVNPCGKCPSCCEITNGSSMDVIEIDGASNNSVDNIRELRENIALSPIHGRFKIYIIDEVHMLSMGAFNALLKTLEEPPRHAKFIFATTEIQKVPATILSRCQRFPFRRVPLTEILKKLRQIAGVEKIEAEEEALALIARAAEGSLRDAEGQLDQIACFSSGKITVQKVEHMLGLASADIYIELLKAWGRKDALESFRIFERATAQGFELLPLVRGLYEMTRHFLIARVHPDPRGLIDLADETRETIQKESKAFSVDGLLAILAGLEKLMPIVQYSPLARFAFEAAVMRFASIADTASIPEILKKLERLEKREGVRLLATGESGVSDPARPAAAKGGPSNAGPPEQHGSGSRGPEEIPLAKIEEVWPRVLKAVEHEKVTLALALKEAEPLGVENGALILGFPVEFRYHKETAEEPAARELTELVLERELGKRLSLKPVLMVPEIAEGEEKKPAPPAGEIPPIVESALSDVFKGGRVVRRQ